MGIRMVVLIGNTLLDITKGKKKISLFRKTYFHLRRNDGGGKGEGGRDKTQTTFGKGDIKRPSVKDNTKK